MRRTRALNIRLTENQLIEVRRRAKAEDRSITNYVLRTVLAGWRDPEEGT